MTSTRARGSATGGADSAAGYGLAVDQERRHLLEGDVLAVTEAAKQRRVPGAVASEVKVVSLDDGTDPQVPEKNVLEEGLGAEAEQSGVGSEDEDVVGSGLYMLYRERVVGPRTRRDQ